MKKKKIPQSTRKCSEVIDCPAVPIPRRGGEEDQQDGLSCHTDVLISCCNHQNKAVPQFTLHSMQRSERFECDWSERKVAS